MEKNNIEEIWKPVLGYEGLYEASSLGRIKSLNYGRTGKVKVLKPGPLRGYLGVTLCKDRKRKSFSVQRLIYSAFKGEIPPGMHVDHINNIGTDNRLENLQLLTPADNVRKSWKGRIPWNKGKKHSEEAKAKMSAAAKARYQREKNLSGITC